MGYRTQDPLSSFSPTWTYLKGEIVNAVKKFSVCFLNWICKSHKVAQIFICFPTLKDTVINAFIKHANDNDGVKDNFSTRVNKWPRPLLKNQFSCLWYYHVQKLFLWNDGQAYEDSIISSDSCEWFVYKKMEGGVRLKTFTSTNMFQSHLVNCSSRQKNIENIQLLFWTLLPFKF